MRVLKLVPLFLFVILSCTKSSINNLKDEQAEIAFKPPSSSIVDPDEGKKKYAPKICYVPGDPNSLGTVCEDPGDKCKSYDCTATSGNRISGRLTESEIDKYATIDAEFLLKKGLIENADFEYFKNFSRNALIERNKNLLIK